MKKIFLKSAMKWYHIFKITPLKEMAISVDALVVARNQGVFVVKKETLKMKLHVWLVVIYTEFWNKELLLSGKVEMKAGE